MDFVCFNGKSEPFVHYLHFFPSKQISNFGTCFFGMVGNGSILRFLICPIKPTEDWRHDMKGGALWCTEMCFVLKMDLLLLENEETSEILEGAGNTQCSLSFPLEYHRGSTQLA